LRDGVGAGRRPWEDKAWVGPMWGNKRKAKLETYLNRFDQTEKGKIPKSWLFIG
jgi:hypothetical protein